jgi:hypothetical protein
MELLWLKKELGEDGSYVVSGQRENGLIGCPGCGGTYALVEDVEGWLANTGEVTAWGPGLAHCEPCGLLLVDYWEGSFAYFLREEGCNVDQGGG